MTESELGGYGVWKKRGGDGARHGERSGTSFGKPDQHWYLASMVREAEEKRR